MEAGLETLRREVFHRNPGESEFHQAVTEVFEALGPGWRWTTGPRASKTSVTA